MGRKVRMGCPFLSVSQVAWPVSLEPATPLENEGRAALEADAWDRAVLGVLFQDMGEWPLSHGPCVPVEGDQASSPLRRGTP